MRGRRSLFALLAVLAFAQFAYGGTVAVTSLAETGAGTLADAIGQANSGACAAPCAITFSTSGTITISTSFLPPITAANVTINGYSAPGAAVNTNAFGLADNAAITVQIQGPGSGDGISVGAGGTSAVIRGLAIGGFTNGISIAGATSQVMGNFIGTDTTGNNANPNTTGVLITAAGVFVGATNADRNVISGNSVSGVVFDTGATNGLVEGNYIGLRADSLTSITFANGAGVQINAGLAHQIGTAGRGNHIVSFGVGVEVNTTGNSVRGNRIGPAANGDPGLGNSVGVYVTGNSNTVGGGISGDSNQISSNVNGVIITGNSNALLGNLIGTDAAGTAPAGNFDDGVIIEGSNNTISNNTIEYNSHGVVVHYAGTGNTILGNRIANNSNMGIDLRNAFDSGITPNDPGDADPDFFGGGNNLQNFPQIDSATLSGGTLTLNVSVDSGSVAATQSIRLQTFDQNGTLLDNRCITGNKFGPLGISIASAPVSTGDSIVMTATSYTDSACASVGDGTSELTYPPATVAAPLVVINTNDSGAGSLRQAILDANACSSACAIVFNIPAPWPPVIQPLTPLPAITADGTIVDGGTQTIFSSDANASGPDVVLDGTSAGAGVNGITIQASSVVIRGMVIRRFSGAGIAVTDPVTTRSNNVIAGNYIGVDANGTSAAGNGTGILLADHANSTSVGGSTAHDRNVISGNSGDGIRMTSFTSSGNVVAGNYIGTDASGAVAVANNRGVSIDSGAVNNHVGSFGFFVLSNGVAKEVRRSARLETPPAKASKQPFKLKTAATCGCTPFYDNLISGNTVAGVTIDSAGGGGGPIGDFSTGTLTGLGLILIGGFPNTVTGNFIGTDAGGDNPIPNGAGVQVSGTTIAAIIGDYTGLGNVIGYNTGAGVTVCGAATGVYIRGNDIFANGALGIDLNCDGVTPNDPLDADTGPNGLSNFPVIIATGVVDGAGVIHAQPSTSYDIDVFASTSPDPSGNGEGEFFIGTSSVFTDANGDGYFSFPTDVPAGYWITLTATNISLFDPTTSEFSAPVQMYSTPGTTAAVVDIATKTIPTHIYTGGDAPTAVAWNGNTSAVVALRGAKLARLDMSKTPPPITDTLVLASFPLKNVAVNPAGTQALVTSADDKAFLVDLTTNPMTLLGTATLPQAGADGIAFFAGGTKALVANGTELAVLDLTTPSSIGVTSLSLSGTSVDVAVNAAGTRAVVTSDYGVHTIDLTTPTVTLIDELNFSVDLRGVVITADGTLALAAGTAIGAEAVPGLYVFDISSGSASFDHVVELPEWTPTAVRLLASGTAIVASRFGLFFIDAPYTAVTTLVTDSPLFSGSATDSLDVNAAGTKALNLNVDTPNLLPNASCTASLPFGTVNVGSSSTLTVNCTNNGGTTLTVSSIGVSGTGFTLGTAPATPFAVDPAGTFNYQVTFTPPSGGPFTGTATVVNNGSSGNAATSLSGTGLLTADLSITKSGPASFTPGQNVTFTVTVTNNGPNSAANVVVTDPDPAGTTFVSNSGGCVTAYPCNLGTLAPSQVVTITSTYTVSPAYNSATISNTASVSSTTSDPNGTNNSTTVTSGGSALTDVGITKTGPASVTAGQTITYTITVTNAGPSDASSVTVADTTPAGLTPVGNTGACTTAFPCALGTVAAGQSKVINATYSVPLTYNSPNVTNTATVSSTTPDSSSANNSSSVTTPVNPANADVAIVKSGPAAIAAGSSITYTITVTNNGPGPANAVSVADSTPPGLTFSGNAGDCTTGFPCTLGSIAAGQSKVITSTFIVPAGYNQPSITNTASVSASTPDATSTNNSSSVTTTVTQAAADVAVTKSGPGNAATGEVISYIIVVRNNGPADATGVVLNDPTPPGLTFNSASGGGCTSFPCTIGTLPSGQSRTVVANYVVNSAAGSVTNTASVTSGSPDPNAANNSASVTTITACPEAPVILQPSNGATGAATSGTLSWSDVGAAQYKVYFGAGNSGCQTLIVTTTATHIAYSGLNPGTQYQWRVEAVSAGCPLKTSSCATFTTASACPAPPALLTPANGTQASSPITFSWTAVAGATSYTVFASVNGGASTSLGITALTSLTATLEDGPVAWFVVADAGAACQLRSTTGNFNACNAGVAPAVRVVAEIQTGQTYAIEWDDMNAARYEVDESSTSAFLGGSTTTTTTTLTKLSFTHTSTVATPYFYRVRAFSSCGQKFGPDSDVVRVVIAPIPPPDDPHANAPLGSTQPVTLKVFVPGFPEGNVPFSARVDKPWATVAPTSGILPPGGITFTITVDPTGLPAGTWEATVIITIGSPSAASKIVPLVDTTIKIPVSISIVTPVGSTKSTEPPANAMIIPTAGHLGGIASKWQSDVRLANTGFSKIKYQINFVPAGPDASKNIKSTTLEVDAGATAALNDVVRNWYGLGSLGESSNGVLEIRPLGGAKTLDLHAGVTVQTVSVASSRTYNVTSQGTLGQFIPAITFSSFIAKAASSFIPTLGLQQIAQSSAFRTNLGVVEGSGKPANVLVSVFDIAGNNLLNFPLELAANEQKQLNSFLATNNISIPDGRIEVKVTSGDGKVTAYASVIDNASGDPLLVDGVPLRAQSFDRYVLPGVAALQNGFANWQSDVRVYNPSTQPQTATFTYYPQNGNGAPQTTAMTINAGETKVLDNALQTLFALTNSGGALHVSTAAASNLVVSARTYNKTSAGTFGQFIPAVTEANAIGAGEGALQILQVEESVRYRTNLGIASVNGKPAEVEISAFVPGSKVAAHAQFTLGANEFRQFNVLHEMGMEDVYNARVQVRVLSGDGKIAAYGSVVDMQTQDPTFVPAQLSQ